MKGSTGERVPGSRLQNISEVCIEDCLPGCREAVLRRRMVLQCWARGQPRVQIQGHAWEGKAQGITGYLSPGSQRCVSKVYRDSGLCCFCPLSAGWDSVCETECCHQDICEASIWWEALDHSYWTCTVYALNLLLLLEICYKNRSFTCGFKYPCLQGEPSNMSLGAPLLADLF